MAGAIARWWNKADHMRTDDPQTFSQGITKQVNHQRSFRTQRNAEAILQMAKDGEVTLSNNQRFELQMVAEPYLR